MTIIDSKQYPKHDSESFSTLLKQCSQIARKKEHGQLVSLSLEAKHIDPLAVLKSIHHASHAFFFLDHPISDQSIAGNEALFLETFSGDSRFSKAQAYWENLLKNTILVGNASLPFSGPYGFCAFSFYDEIISKNENDFESFSLFIPRWQIASSQGKYVCVANIWIEPNMSSVQIEATAESVYRQHKKFLDFDYTTGSDTEFSNANLNVNHCTIQDVLPKEHYEQSVTKAIQHIQSKRYEKITLARAVDLTCESNYCFSALQSLNCLRERFPSCHTYAFGNGEGPIFLGSSPEKLLKLTDNLLQTDALAGSISRGSGPREDAQLAASLLLSAKDRHEQQLVTDYILLKLRQLGLLPEKEIKPKLIKLPNIYHLNTPIIAKNASNQSIFKIAEVLHPTPALGGLPREEALADIRKLEGFERGLYGGGIGWINAHNEGEIIVGIRSALIHGQQARIFAGAGIVENSDPVKEKKETEVKMKVMREMLQIVPL